MISFLILYSLILVLRPWNPVTECIITLRPKENYYERSRVYCDIQVDKVSLHVNSEQISDVFDFIKVQNYTTFYGTDMINDLFSTYFIYMCHFF